MCARLRKWFVWCGWWGVDLIAGVNKYMVSIQYE